MYTNIRDSPFFAARMKVEVGSYRSYEFDGVPVSDVTNAVCVDDKTNIKLSIPFRLCFSKPAGCGTLKEYKNGRIRSHLHCWEASL